MAFTFSVVVQLLSRVQLCDPMDCSTPDSFDSWSLLKFMSIESVMLSNHLITVIVFIRANTGMFKYIILYARYVYTCICVHVF